MTSGMKVGLGLLAAAGVLFVAKTASAASGTSSTGEGATNGGAPPTPPTGPSSQAQKDALDAQKATAVFSLALSTGGSALVWFTEGAAAPYVGSIGGAVAASWSQLSMRDKARVFRGETS
ncbi:MAG: hypothetical protein Q7R30_22430 [Acidobacteriota bacterium]|nr:hypothetical protein [Acidobacteriota bacterium]